MEPIRNFIIWDYYDDYGFIDGYDTETEARAAAKQRNEDTDGECQIVMYAFSASKNRYEVVA